MSLDVSFNHLGITGIAGGYAPIAREWVVTVCGPRLEGRGRGATFEEAAGMAVEEMRSQVEES